MLSPERVAGVVQRADRRRGVGRRTAPSSGATGASAPCWPRPRRAGSRAGRSRGALSVPQHPLQPRQQRGRSSSIVSLIVRAAAGERVAELADHLADARRPASGSKIWNAWSRSTLVVELRSGSVPSSGIVALALAGDERRRTCRRAPTRCRTSARGVGRQRRGVLLELDRRAARAAAPCPRARHRLDRQHLADARAADPDLGVLDRACRRRAPRR